MSSARIENNEKKKGFFDPCSDHQVAIEITVAAAAAAAKA